MFWKKKETKGLPDLPDANENRPSIDIYNRPPLEPIRPRFPDKSQGFLQQAPRSFPEQQSHSEDNSDGSELPSLPGSHFPEIPSQSGRKPRIIEIDSNEPQSVPEREEFQESEYKVATPSFPTSGLSKRRVEEKLFVRLDKFKNARDALDAVKEKLKDMDNLLKEIREVKTREDHELSSWESEVEIVRSTISSIGKEIFEGAEE